MTVFTVSRALVQSRLIDWHDKIAGSLLFWMSRTCNAFATSACPSMGVEWLLDNECGLQMLNEQCWHAQCMGLCCTDPGAGFATVSNLRDLNA